MIGNSLKSAVFFAGEGKLTLDEYYFRRIGMEVSTYNIF